MPLYFKCVYCHEDMQSNFLKIGESYKCKNCSKIFKIPRDATGVTGSKKKDSITISDVFDHNYELENFKQNDATSQDNKEIEQQSYTKRKVTYQKLDPLLKNPGKKIVSKFGSENDKIN